MPISPSFPTGGTVPWDIPLNTALDEMVVAINDNEAALLTKADLTHTHDAANIVSGVLDPTRLGTGTADTTTFLRGDGTWDIPASNPTLLGKAVFWTAMPTTAIWVMPGDQFIIDAGLSGTSNNGTIFLTNLDVGLVSTVNDLGTNLLTNPTNGSSIHFGIWASGANGEATGFPIWYGSTAASTSGNKSITVSPTVTAYPGERLWVGILSLGWDAGEFKRQIVSTVGVGRAFEHYGSDTNAALSGISTPMKFPNAKSVTGAATINTDLTGATFNAIGNKPHLAVRITRV